MKKRAKQNKVDYNLKFWFITIVIILLVIAATILIKNYTGRAIDPSNTEDPLGIGLNPDNIPQTPEDAAQVSKDYLKKEWVKVLNNTDHPLGKALWATHRGLVFLSPVFKVLVGIEYSFSWLFLLTLVIWVTLVTFFYRILSVFSTFSKWASFAISLCVIVIISAMRIPLTLSNKIIDAINLLTSWPIRLALIIALIIGLILISTFSKQCESLVKKWKENRKKMKIAMEIAELKAQGKTQAEIQKIIMDSFGEVGDALDN